MCPKVRVGRSVKAPGIAKPIWFLDAAQWPPSMSMGSAERFPNSGYGCRPRTVLPGTGL